MVKVQLTIRAEKLKRVGLARTGCPYAVVKITAGEREGEELGRTEVLEDDLNPSWTSPIFADADKSQYLPFVVEIRDERDDRIMAQANFEMTEVFLADNHEQFEEKIEGLKIYAHAAESIKGEFAGELAFRMRGLEIKNVESGVLGLGISDPFYEISKKSSDPNRGIVTWIPAYRSEYMKDNLNPYWQPRTLSLERLCYNDLEWPLKITVWDWQRSGHHRRIGEAEITLQGIIDHLTKRGNASRDGAIHLTKIGGTKTKGFMVVLQADLNLED